MRAAKFRSLVIAIAWIVIGWSVPKTTFVWAEPSQGTVDCSRSAGSDAGAKIQACLDELSSGGIADARGLTGQQSIRQPIRFTHAGTVLMLPPAATFTFADGMTLDISASEVHIEGAGTTSIFRLGNGSAIRIGTAQQPVWGWRLERLAIEPASGKSPSAGLLLNNAREGILREVSASGFAGSAIDVGENCWSDRSVDSRVIKNGIGYNFHGNNLNAWNIRGGLVSANRVGINLDLGTGKLQGFFISDGTQMEANTDAAIRLVSGVMQGIYLSDIYSELFESQRLIKTEEGTAGLKVNLLSITNGYVYSKDTPPVYVTTRPIDVANVSISNLLVRHSQRQLPVAEASGQQTSIVVSESASYSSTNDASEILILSRDGARATTLRGGVPAH
jgi:hypothetical protein